MNGLGGRCIESGQERLRTKARAVTCCADNDVDVLFCAIREVHGVVFYALNARPHSDLAILDELQDVPSARADCGVHLQAALT
jgi:hypothetical protein